MTIAEIKRIQGIVGADQDGVIGSDTKKKIAAYQATLGVTADGIWGPKTEAAYTAKSSSPVNQSRPVNQSFPTTNQSTPPPMSTPVVNQSTPVKTTPTPTPTPTASTSGYSGGSIVDYLSSTGQPSDYGSRAALAAKLGITGYTGSAAQNTQLLNMLKSGATSTYISPTMTKSDYAATPEGQAAGATSSTIPEDVLPSSMQNLAVYNLPDEAFQSLVPQLIPGTPEYQQAMDKISTAYFDVMQQQMNAGTEQEQQAAQYNWQTLKKYIETNLNINLSNDALQAWDQVQGLKNQFGSQNLEGSGLQNESVDSYLKKVRLTDAATRNESQTKEEAAQQDYYMKFATPDQIKALIASNPQKAKDWGLLPSDNKTMAQRASEMKAKYPNMSDDEIQQNLATMYDESGNYRSDLYQKYMTGSNLGANQGNVDTANIVYDQYGNPIVKPVKPSDTGVLDINAAREQYQTLNTPLANLKADDEARRALGSTPPTSGAASGTSAGTQFNTIKPSGSATKPPASNPAPTLDKPIIVPSSMTSNGNPTSGQKAPDDPTNKYNTSTGQLNPNYKAPASATPTTGSKPKYTGSSIVDYLNSSGQASDYASRAAQAAKLGITGYTGSAAQNTQMLQMLNK